MFIKINEYSFRQNERSMNKGTLFLLNVHWIFNEQMNVHWMFFERSMNWWTFNESMNIQWTFNEQCSLSVHWMFLDSLNVHWMFSERSMNVHLFNEHCSFVHFFGATTWKEPIFDPFKKYKKNYNLRKIIES